MINDANQTNFDFSDHDDNLVLSVYDFTQGEEITFRKNKDGFILQNKESETRDEKGYAIEKKVVYGYITKNGNPETMKINNSNLRSLRAISKGKVENLLDKKFKVDVRKSDKIQYIVLLLS